MNDSELDQLLKSCDTPVRPPEAFQRDVWCRIETAEFADWKTRLTQALDRLLGVIALPRFAFATCATVALAGAWIGTKSAAPNSNSEVSYVQSISPFAQSHH